MKIQLDILKQDPRFRVTNCDHKVLGPVILINPEKAFFDWNESELHLRSLVTWPDGTVISAGFPKFFNYGEVKAHDDLTLFAINNKATKLYKKLDGSLIIRSVVLVEGKEPYVYFRTRGSAGLGQYEEPVLKLIAAKYPKLLDTRFFVNCNLLLEYTAPDNQIVIRYSEPQLWYIGYSIFVDDQLKVYHGDDVGMSIFGMPEIQEYKPELLNLESIKENLSALTGEEGYVSWSLLSDGSQHLSKLKAAWYLKLHAMRSNASPQWVREFCFWKDINTLQTFKEALAEEGFVDWELVSYLEPLFYEVGEQNSKICEKLATVRLKLQTEHVFSMETRKDKALKCKELFSKEMFPYAISLAAGEQDKAIDFENAMLLNVSVAAYKQMLLTKASKVATNLWI